MYILIGVLFYLHYIRLFVFLSYELCICLFRDSFIDLLIYLNLWWEFLGKFLYQNYSKKFNIPGLLIYLNQRRRHAGARRAPN